MFSARGDRNCPPGRHRGRAKANTPPDSVMIWAKGSLRFLLSGRKGVVRPYKGLDYLIDAFRELVDKFDVALVIAGEFFSGLSQYQKELQKAGIAERTYLFPRYIPYEEVPLFFGAADIVVQPYVRFSGQSGVTQTAYLHSLPVVATEVGGLPELVLQGKTGYIVKPANVGELAVAIEALLADAERRREYGANGRTFLETHLAWEKIVDRLLEIYAES